MTLIDLQTETSRTVKLFQYSEWPTTGVPSSGQPMCQLYSSITAYQNSKVVLPEESIYGNAAAIDEQARGAQIKPVVVLCSAGVGRTGAFCAMANCLKRLELEKVADPFTVVKHLRTQRMSMVQTADQYEFVYRVLLDCLFPLPLHTRKQTNARAHELGEMTDEIDNFWCN